VEEFDESGPEIVKRFMYVNRKAPYGTIYALECLEVVLISAAFDQDVSVVFLDDGVYQLKKSQDTTDIGMKNFSKTYGALDDYDVEKIYVEKESLEARGLTPDDLVIPVEVMAAESLREIMAQQDVVISS
jgi:tRNA 2-thiouridine synthesizing protein C